MDAMRDMLGFFNANGNMLSADAATPAERQANLEKFYTKVAEQYNMDELRAILDCEETMLILSGAGSGKTTALILKLIRDYMAGRFTKTIQVNGQWQQVPTRILVCTFLRTGADELRKAFIDKCTELGITGINTDYIYFKTIHSEALSALKDMGYIPKIGDPADFTSMIKQTMKECQIKSPLSNGKTITQDEVSDMTCLMGYVRNRLDGEKYLHPLLAEYNIDSLSFKLAMQTFYDLKRLRGVVDFEDLQEILLDAYGSNPHVVNYIRARYDYIYVDEFQDTSQLQYAILKEYFNGAKGVICIGDDDQTIYSWRGSDSNIITHRFEEDYKPVVTQLTVNYRCKANILNTVLPSIVLNKNRHAKQLRASAPGGTVNLIIDGSITHMMTAVKEDLIAGKSVGVLARTNADLLIPAILMELDGTVDYGVSGSIDLEGRIPKQVLGAISLVSKRYTEDFSSLLSMFVSKYNTYQVDKLCTILATNPDYTLYNIPINDIRYSADALYPFISRLRTYDSDPVAGYCFILKYMYQNVFDGKTIYAQRAKDFVYYIRKLIQEHEGIKTLSISEIDYLFNVKLRESLRQRKSKSVGEHKIKITTVHDSKGKEWNSVYIWNNIEGCFPSTVGNRELLDAEVEEERRVHYIAMTRAKDKLTIYTQADKFGLFLKECNLEGITEHIVTKKAQIAPVSSDNTAHFESIVRDYYKKYTSYEWVIKQEGVNLDICDVKFGGRANVIAKLIELSIDKYPTNLVESAITDALRELATA